jgi:hypothetical protein
MKKPHVTKKSANVAPLALLSLPRFNKGWTLVAIFFSIFQPGPAFVLGLLYVAQNDAGAKRFGRLCLALSILGFLMRLALGRHFESMDGGESFLQPFN